MTLYQSLLEMNVQLCKAFPALTPFAVRRESAHEVFLLVRRINSQPRTDRSLTTETRQEVDKRGRIRRPAGDNWF